MTRWRYLRPKSLAEALEALGTEGARPLAGGTDLVLLLRDRALSASLLVDVGRLEELRTIRADEQGLAIGAACTLTEIAGSPEVPPVLRRACLSVGTPQIRNLATLAGNVSNSSPAGDTIPPLLAMDASVTVARESGARSVRLARFFTGPKTNVLRPGELVTEVCLPRAALHLPGYFEKLGRRRAGAIAVINCAAVGELRAGRISLFRLALGSVAPTPIVVEAAASQDPGRGEGPDLTLEAEKSRLFATLESLLRPLVRPITDVRGPSAYRTAVASTLAWRAVEAVSGGEAR